MKKFKVSSIEFDFDSISGVKELSEKKLKDLKDHVINNVWEVDTDVVDDVQNCIDLTDGISDDTNWLVKDIEYDQVEISNDEKSGYEIIPDTNKTFLNMNMRLHCNGIDVGDEEINNINEEILEKFKEYKLKFKEMREKRKQMNG